MTRIKVVSNAGPLIYLAVLRRFSLLKDLFSEIYLPSAVYEEVVVQGAGQPGADETFTAVKNGWLQRVAVDNRIAVDALLGELDLSTKTLSLIKVLALPFPHAARPCRLPDSRSTSRGWREKTSGPSWTP